MSRMQLIAPSTLTVDGRVLEITAVTDDSRVVASGDLFLLLPAAGAHQLDGTAQGYLRQAIQRGAGAVVSVGAGVLLQEVMTVPHLALATMEEAGQWLRRLLGSLANHAACLGVTGTDGKTSTVWMLRQALQRLHGSSWSLGTLGRIEKEGARLPLPNTTPSLLTMQQTLAEATVQQVKTLVCEVSSHGIAQQRIAGMPFSAALWSNIGCDHLHDHGGMDAYVELKARFMRRVVDQGGVAVANADQPMVVTALQAMKQRVFWYGREQGDHCPDNHLCWRSLASDRVELQMGSETQVLDATPVAEFHHENLAATAALLLHADFAAFAQLSELLSNMTAPLGRMQSVADRVFIDYAHTPEALAALLASARKLCNGRLLLVFGCGGDREQSKRPQMGAVAARGADIVWLTEDNSRSENPQTIANHVLAGVANHGERLQVELDRETAIVTALQALEADDLLLIAGKGHEDYIERNGVRTPWSDADCVQRFFNLHPQSQPCG